MITTAGELIGPDSERWQSVLQRCWHQVYHLPQYVSFDAELAGGLPRAFHYCEGDDVFLLPLVVRAIPGTMHHDAVSPYGYPGPISNSNDEEFWGRAAAALRGTLQDAQLVSLFVRMDPLQRLSCQPLARIGTLLTHGATVSIDLRQTREQWWTQVRKDHREGINRSRRLGRTSVMDDWAHLDSFVSLYRETMERVGAANAYYYGRDYFQRLLDVMGDQVVHLLIVLAEGEPIAGSVLLGDGKIMQAHLAGTRATFQRREETSRFLVHEAVQWGRDHGYEYFHLGGGVGGSEDSVFNFKKGFSPRRHAFQTLRVITDPDNYRKLSHWADPSADPADLSSFFPLYRKEPAAARLGGVG